MGWIRHHAIIVTAWDNGRLQRAHKKALDIFTNHEQYVSEITEIGLNGYCSFLIGPDGSKEGWTESDDVDDLRDKIIQYLRQDPDETYCDWVEVEYGEVSAAKVTRAHTDCPDE